MKNPMGNPETPHETEEGPPARLPHEPRPVSGELIQPISDPGELELALARLLLAVCLTQTEV